MQSQGLAIVVSCMLVGVLWFASVRPLVARLAPQLVRWRAVSVDPARYFDVASPVAADPALDAEMAKCNLHWLGDRMVEHAGGVVLGPVRWLRDDSGSVFGLAGTVRPDIGPARDIVALMTATTDSFVATIRGGPRLHLATAPGTRNTSVPAATPLESVLSKHRADVAAASGRVLAVSDCDSAIAVHGEGRARVARWRLDQPYDALLDADLRGVFRGPFAGLRSIVRRRVVALEKATLRT